MREEAQVATKSSQPPLRTRAADAERVASSHHCHSAVGSVFDLHRIIGNRAVQRLFKSGTAPARSKIGPAVSRDPATGSYTNASQNENSASTGLFDAIEKIFNPAPRLLGISSAPKAGNCGEMSWETRWELSEYGRGGFVIQEVHWRERLQRYCDRPWTEESTKTYHEAWWVVKNGKSPANDDAVPDTMGRKIPHESARGSIEIDATAQYHDDVAEAQLPADMVRFNPDTNAGSLRSSLNKPILDGNLSKPILHYIKFEWDCCDDRGRRIVRPTQVVARIP